MAFNTKIEWTDRTWNPLRGCTRVSEGCRNCYAEDMAARFSDPGQWGHGFAERTPAGGRWTGNVEVQWDRIDLPLRWRKPAKIFASSTSDWFHEALPVDEIANLFAIAVAAVHVRGHTFQILTKRVARMREVLTSGAFWDQVNAEAGEHVGEYVDPLARRSDDARATLDDYDPENPPPGIWLGVSAEDQQRAAERIPHLLATPAAVRFVSCEPLLGPIDLTELPFTKDCDCDGDGPHLNAFTAGVFCEGCCEGPERLNYGTIDWVIAGGESGPRARPMHPDWARGLRDQCAAAEVPLFFKQWGEWAPIVSSGGPPEDAGVLVPHTLLYRDRQLVNAEGWYAGHGPGVRSTIVDRLGKARAGALLDGREHKEFPVI